jgi:hypothetical protein
MLLVTVVLVALVATLVVIAGCPAQSGNDEGTYGVGMHNLGHKGHKAPANAMTTNAMMPPVANGMAAPGMAPSAAPGKAPLAPPAGKQAPAAPMAPPAAPPAPSAP